MKCNIRIYNIKYFIKVLQTLSKLNDEICMEALENGFLLSAYSKIGSAVCKFYNTFFAYYKNALFLGTDKNNVWNISIRSIMHVFDLIRRNKNQVSSFDIICRAGSLEFNFKYEGNLPQIYHISTREKYIHILPIEICTRNIITGSSSLYSRILKNFSDCDEVITFDVSPNAIFVRNYYCGAQNATVTRTQYSLSVNEFISYNIQKNYKFRFHMQTFRACVHLACYVNAPVTLKFQTPNKPVVISVSQTNLFDVDFKLSTFTQGADDDIIDLETIVTDYSEINRAKLNQQHVLNKTDETPAQTLAANKFMEAASKYIQKWDKAESPVSDTQSSIYQSSSSTSNKKTTYKKQKLSESLVEDSISISSEPAESAEDSGTSDQNSLYQERQAFVRYIFPRLFGSPKKINEEILARDSNPDSDNN